MGLVSIRCGRGRRARAYGQGGAGCWTDARTRVLNRGYQYWYRATYVGAWSRRRNLLDPDLQVARKSRRLKTLQGGGNAGPPQAPIHRS